MERNKECRLRHSTHRVRVALATFFLSHECASLVERFYVIRNSKGVCYYIKKAHGILFLRNPSINPMGFLMFYFFMFYFQKSYYNFMYFADIYPTTSLFLSLIRTLYQPFEVFPIMVTFVPLL